MADNIGAFRESDTEKVECRKCHTPLVINRTGAGVMKGTYSCPVCHSTFTYVWQTYYRKGK